MAKFSKLFAGFAFGTALTLSFLPTTSVSAAPFGGISALRHEQALPLLDVQVRRPVRRPVRAVKRRNNNALAAGALIGAAIIGGAIIANSNRRPRREYYYDTPGYPADYYRRPQPYYGGPAYYQAPSQYRGPQYYQPQPYYEAQPRRRYRNPAADAQPNYQPQQRQRWTQPTDVHGNPVWRNPYRDGIPVARPPENRN
jgi:hypothetical protein